MRHRWGPSPCTVSLTRVEVLALLLGGKTGFGPEVAQEVPATPGPSAQLPVLPQGKALFGGWGLRKEASLHCRRTASSRPLPAAWTSQWVRDGSPEPRAQRCVGNPSVGEGGRDQQRLKQNQKHQHAHFEGSPDLKFTDCFKELNILVFEDTGLSKQWTGFAVAGLSRGRDRATLMSLHFPRIPWGIGHAVKTGRNDKCKRTLLFGNIGRRCPEAPREDCLAGAGPEEQRAPQGGGI